MKPLTLEDIPSAEIFEACRTELRAKVIAHKDQRRIAVGHRVTLLFEDRETLRWQILEMCRVEGTRDAAGIQQELDVYNDLVPGELELSATLFIEITDLAEIRPELDRLIGMDEHVLLQIGEETTHARFDEKQLEEDRLSAVQYIRFPLSAAQAAALGTSDEPARLVIDHPEYQAVTELPERLRAGLALDLEGGAGPLVDFAGIEPAELPDDAVIVSRGRVRAIRPARARAPGHVVVEPIDCALPYPELPPDWLAELHALAQEIATALIASHGRCRITLDAGAATVRIDVYAPPGP